MQTQPAAGSNIDVDVDSPSGILLYHTITTSYEPCDTPIAGQIARQARVDH
jgi:hypothetical protein